MYGYVTRICAMCILICVLFTTKRTTLSKQYRHNTVQQARAHGCVHRRIVHTLVCTLQCSTVYSVRRIGICTQCLTYDIYTAWVRFKTSMGKSTCMCVFVCVRNHKLT